MALRVAAIAVLAAMLGAFAGEARAHPHVWVTVRTEIVHDGQGRIAAFRHHWTFDEFFSGFATQGLDRNGDGTFDRAELAELAKVNVTSLAEFDFFTFPKAGGEKVELGPPLDGYHLVHENGRLTLHFTLPLETPLDPRTAGITFSIYDPTYYVAFSYAGDSPVRLVENAPAACRAEMPSRPEPQPEVTNLGEAFFQNLGTGSDFGARFARDVAIACGAR